MQNCRRRLAVFTIIAALLSLFSAAGAMAQTNPPDGTTDAKTNQHVLPKVEFSNTPLEDIVAYLHELDPDFQAVVARVPGAEDNYPVVSLKLNNVSPEEILHVIEMAYPRVEVRSTAKDQATTVSNKRPIYVITVAAPQVIPGPGGVQIMPDGRVVQAQHVVVYNLSSLVAVMAKAPVQMDAPAAMKNILEVVNAVCHQLPQDPKVVMQVHQATHVLIVTGSDEQQQAVSEAIAALQPPSPSREELVAAADAQARLAELEQRRNKLVDEFTSLQANVKAVEATYGPASDKVRQAQTQLDVLGAQRDETSHEIDRLHGNLDTAGSALAPPTQPSQQP